jgi:hypothetical protein
MKARTLCWILVGAGWLDAQAVLSRRDYVEHGRTFPQIWMADAGTLNFRQLTHSARDHSEPVCSRDGKLIYFVSDRDVERSRNSYGDYHSNEREVWAYDRQTSRSVSYGALRATSGWTLKERLRMAECSYLWGPNCAAWRNIRGSSIT